jgi:hypothetical protein
MFKVRLLGQSNRKLDNTNNILLGSPVRFLDKRNKTFRFTIPDTVNWFPCCNGVSIQETAPYYITNIVPKLLLIRYKFLQSFINHRRSIQILDAINNIYPAYFKLKALANLTFIHRRHCSKFILMAK